MPNYRGMDRYELQYVREFLNNAWHWVRRHSDNTIFSIEDWCQWDTLRLFDTLHRIHWVRIDTGYWRDYAIDGHYVSREQALIGISREMMEIAALLLRADERDQVLWKKEGF